MPTLYAMVTLLKPFGTHLHAMLPQRSMKGLCAGAR